LKADAVLGFARARAGKAIQETGHVVEKQGGKLNANEGTKRKDACLNAESSITCSQTPWPSPANLRTLRCRLFLFEIYIDRSGAAHNPQAGKVQELD
jgi:hypothetical protein